MEDPRCNLRNQIKHSIPELMFLVISAVISGQESWRDIHTFGKLKTDWLRQFFPYEHGVPCHSTLSRFFARLNTEQFGHLFIEWMHSISTLTKGEVVALDGKTMRGSLDPDDNRAAIHMVSAFVARQSLCLGQLATDQKSNEITAIPALLDLLELDYCTVTIDAMGCQKKVAEKILSKNAEYVLQVKNNQKGLLEQIEKVFRVEAIADEHLEHDLGHGRIEKRHCEVITDLKFLDEAVEWPELKSIIRINAERVNKKTGEIQTNTRYYISSKKAEAKVFNSDIRSHWAIENKLHWSLDVTFKEDSSKKRKKNSAANFALFNKMAINLLKQNTEKATLKAKRLKALVDDSFRELLLKI